MSWACLLCDACGEEDTFEAAAAEAVWHELEEHGEMEGVW